MQRTPEYFEKMGRQLWFRGEYYRALKLMQEGLALFPSDFRLRLGVALAQLRLGNYAIARDLLKELLESSPNNGDALSAMCEAYLKLGKKQDALDCAAAILKYHRKSGILLEHLGMAFLEHGLFDEAKDAFEHSLKAEPGRPYALLGLGIVYSGLRRPEMAIRQIRRAVRAKPGFYEAVSYLANLLFDRGQKAQAMKLFRTIPVDELVDPVTISRITQYAKADKKLARLLPLLEQRLEKIARGQSITGFLHTLEERAGRGSSSKVLLPQKLHFVRVGKEVQFSPAQKAALYDVEGTLKALYKRPKPGVSFLNLPKPPRARAGDADSFIAAFAVYLKSLSENPKQFPAVPMTRWCAALGIDTIAPYAAALLRLMYEENAQFGVSQRSMDALLAALVNTVKWMPPDLRGSLWLVELGGMITAFWTPVDMLERMFLIREILSQPEKKSLEPVIARARGWRRWLGYKADCRWASPAAQLIPVLPQTYGARKPVTCANCGAPVADYWDIAQPGDKPPVSCGGCEPVYRCSVCRGPMRQVSCGRRGVKVYRCMQCERRHQIATRKPAASRRKTR